MGEKVTRKILATVSEFKKFWEAKGPFRYALTSREYPPVLLDDEEWLFSDDLSAILKELMQWNSKKIRISAAPIGKKEMEKFGLEGMSRWRIDNFPGEWTGWTSESFNFAGYIPLAVTADVETESPGAIEAAFFRSLGETLGDIGYLLLKPEKDAEAAYLKAYLKEWQDEEAGN